MILLEVLKCAFSLLNLMIQTSTAGIILQVLSVIPLLFLLYTLTHLEKLGIDIKHPRVIVELLIFIGLLVIGLVLWFGPSIGR
jgi:hypothetical protein